MIMLAWDEGGNLSMPSDAKRRRARRSNTFDP